MARRVATVIAALLVLTTALFARRSLFAQLFPDDEHTVRVHEVRVDRATREYVDTIFTRPVAGNNLGEVITDPPMSVEPRVTGVWRWYATNVLRFEPAAALPIASQYRLIVHPAKLVQAGQHFAGEDEFPFRTDDFLVRRVTWSEQPADNASVVLQGQVEFNYAVKPELLAPRFAVHDGDTTARVDLVDGYTSTNISFRTPPIRKEKAPRNVSLVIAADLTPSEGNVPLGHEFVQSIAIGSREKLEVTRADATPGERESVIRIVLSSPVTPAAAEAKLTVTPAVKYHIESEGNDLLLRGRFVPGTTYDVTLNEGLLATDSALLQEPWHQSVGMPDLKPLLDFRSDGMFLSASGYRTLAIDSINIKTAHLSVDRVYRNNIFFYLRQNGSSRYDEDDDDHEPYYRAYVSSYPVSREYGDRIVDKQLDLGSARNRRVTTTVEMEPLVGGTAPGLYKVALTRDRDDDDSPSSSARWLLITDIGIVAKRSKSEMLVWTSSFKDLSPIAGASVTLVSDQNQPLAHGESDARGFVTLKLPKGPCITRDTGTVCPEPFMLVAQRGNDYSFLLLGNTRVDTAPFDVGGDTLPPTGYSAFVYGERTLFRPGETVKGAVVLRDRDLRVPPKMPIILRHKDPEGNDAGSFRVEADPSGIATFELPLPAYTRTGRHTLEALAGDDVIGSWGFQAEEFVPDRIKVDINAPPARTNTLGFNVSSAYLFGAPAASLPVTATVRLVPAPFTAKGYEQFTFGNNSRKFDPRDLLKDDSGTLDANGRKNYSVTVPAGLIVPASLQAVITAHVQEQGGRGVSARSVVPVHPYPLYLGVRRDRDGFEFVALSPDGKESPAPALRAEFYEDAWHTVFRQTSNGGYGYQSTRDAQLLKTISIPAGKRRGRIDYAPAGWGSYRLVLTDPASLASTELEFDMWSGHGSYSPWAMRNPGRLELTLDRNDYAAGETATVSIKSPFAGKALVTVERERVYATQVADLAENSGRVSIVVPAEARPNAYVTVTVIRAADQLEPGEAGRAYGAVRVDCDRAKNLIAPKITAVEDMRSMRKLDVDVTTAPHARVTVAAVDEGILQLVAQKAPDPFGWFYRQLALDVATHDIFALLLPEVKPKTKALAGGSESGEGIAQFLSTDGIRRKKPVAFWSGVLTADGNGRVHASFDIPDFQGAVRLTAVVHDGARFGASETLVRVHDPLVLMPTMPRFAIDGDRLQLPVTLRNDTGRRGRFTITMHAPSLPVANQQLDVDTGREATALFDVTAAQTGALDLSFAAAGNGERTSASGIIPVLAPLPAITDESAGALRGTTDLAPSAMSFRPGTAQRELVISPLPFVQFRGRLDWLIHYPYGCVEQTTSTAFPMLYVADLAEEIDPDAVRGRDVPALIREAVRRLSTMQSASGGFAMWPYGEQVNPWGTVYATHFLVEARRAGYLVESGMYDPALAYVAKLANAQPQYDHEGLRETVYALYVLGRARKPELGTMDFIRAHHLAELSPDMRALLAAAYAGVGNPSAVTQLLSDITQEEQISRFTGGTYASPVRNRALLLLALMDAAPNDSRIPQLVERLTRDAVADRWYTTQETATVLLAVGQYVKRQHALGTYKGRVLLDGKPVGSFTSKTAHFRKLPPNGTLRVVFDGSYNPGAAFYALRTRGIPSVDSYHPAANGLKVTRTFLTRDGNPLPVMTAKQGEMLVIRTDVVSTEGTLQNVVVENLLPAGLEVENPRLSTTETLPWIKAICAPQHADVRDDRVLFFADIDAGTTLSFYTVVRAVTPGRFALPPLQAEAMYSPVFRASTELGTFEVTR